MTIPIELFSDPITRQTLDRFPPIQTQDYTLVTQEGRPSGDELLIGADQYSPQFGGEEAVWLTILVSLGTLGYKFLESMASTLGKELGERIATAIREWRKQERKATQRQVLQFRFDSVIYALQLDETAQEEIISRPETFVQTTLELARREKVRRNRVLYFDGEARQWKV